MQQLSGCTVIIGPMGLGAGLSATNLQKLLCNKRSLPSRTPPPFLAFFPLTTPIPSIIRGFNLFFVLEEPDSVRFHHDIIFCLESDSIVVSFSQGIGKLRVDVLQFWFQHITCDFLSSCIHGVVLFLSKTYERDMTSMRIQFVT